MSKSEFRKVKSNLPSDNSIAKTNEPTDAPTTNLSNSVQGIKFLNFPLFNTAISKSSTFCPALSSCTTEHVCLIFRKATVDIKTARDTNNTRSPRRS